MQAVTGHRAERLGHEGRRHPGAVELAGLDAHDHVPPYPYFQLKTSRDDVAAEELALAEAMGNTAAPPADGPSLGSLAREDQRR